MKQKIICMIAAFMVAIGIHANIAIDSYSNSHGDSFNVVLLTKKDKPYRVSIECETKGNSKGEIWIKPSDVGKFRDALVSLKAKYAEWNETAKENNITDVSKDMPVKFPKVEFVWGISTTFFANGTFKAQWVYKPIINFVLCMANVKASDNRFVDEMFIIRFYNIDDIQNLINALSQEKIDAVLKASENTNLFN